MPTHKDRSSPFRINGLALRSLGATKATTAGEVLNLKKVEDFSGNKPAAHRIRPVKRAIERMKAVSLDGESVLIARSLGIALGDSYVGTRKHRRLDAAGIAEAESGA